MYSDVLSEFVKFFKKAEEDKHIADETLSDTDKMLSDLEHELEFGNRSYHEKARIANKITEIRRERRRAKYQIEQLTPIEDWINKNQSSIRSLEKLLGEVRKAESHTDPEKLFYNYRTDIIKELFDDDHVLIKGDSHR